MVGDNALIDEYLIFPLIYHLYTYPFLIYSLDIMHSGKFSCILGTINAKNFLELFWQLICSLHTQGNIDLVYYTPVRFGPQIMPLVEQG